MNVKGFILEDEQGREFVMLCQQRPGQSTKTFSLRGWQRLRLVPLQYPECELRHIMAGVLIALNDLFKSLSRLVERIDVSSAHWESVATPDVGETSVVRQVGRVADSPVSDKVPH